MALTNWLCQLFAMWLFISAQPLMVSFAWPTGWLSYEQSWKDMVGKGAVVLYTPMLNTASDFSLKPHETASTLGQMHK